MSVLHLYNKFRSSCNSLLSLRLVIVLKHLVSSANTYSKDDRICSGRSLMKIKNSNGPKILPCGTPDRTGKNSECLLLILTHCFRFKDKIWTTSTDYRIYQVFLISTIINCGTRCQKLYENQGIMMSVWWGVLMILLNTMSSCWVTDLFLQKPNWKGVICELIWSIILSYRSFSSTLEALHNSDIGL